MRELTKASFSPLQLIIFAFAFGLIGLLMIKSFAAPNPNLAGDLNGDNVVNSADLSIMAANYKTTNSVADINQDGIVDGLDVSALFTNYGQTYSGGGTVSQIASIEAESMTPTPTGNGGIGTDATASGGQFRSLWNTGTMFGSVTLPNTASSVKVVASGAVCNTNVWGTFGVTVDSTNLGSATITSQSWSTYTFAGNIAAGTHTVTINYTLPSACADNLYIDVINFFGSSTAPAVTLTASPTTITTGQSSTLTWTSANVTTCTASGAWSGSKATSGSQSVSPTATSTYTLTCSGTGGNANSSATVTFSTTSATYIRGYYDQGPDMLTEWNNYKQYGFNMVFANISSTLLSKIKADGGQAWVQPNIWQGCGYSYSTATALGYAQSAVSSGNITAFYVADEPSVSSCPTAPSQIAAWTAALHQSFPNIPTVIAVYDSGALSAFKNSADMFALDTYPCQYGNGCNYSWITSLAAAADSLGITYVGVPQAFGGDGHYDLPTASQLTQIMDTWRATKEIGYVIYAFSAEGMPSADYVENHPELMAVLQAENAL